MPASLSSTTPVTEKLRAPYRDQGCAELERAVQAGELEPNLTDRLRRVYLLPYSADVIMDRSGDEPWGAFEQFLREGRVSTGPALDQGGPTG
ncbi:MAG: hypothetical protein ABWX96_09995 [Propionibacteriaceae bacterium]